MNKEIIQKIEQAKKLLEECLNIVDANIENPAKTKVLRKLLPSRVKNYSGPKGGLLLLINEGGLKNKHSLDEVKIAMEEKGYMYHKDRIRTALSRLATKTGPVTIIKEGNLKMYVERK